MFNIPDKNEIVEVKDQIYKNLNNDNIKEEIYYDGKLFKKDWLQNSKLYPNIVKYRCKNYRKREKTRNTTFCNA